MKKAYKTPTMKVRKIQSSHMLCLSTFGVNEDEGISTEKNPYSDCDGYGEGWQSSVHNGVVTTPQRQQRMYPQRCIRCCIHSDSFREIKEIGQFRQFISHSFIIILPLHRKNIRRKMKRHKASIVRPSHFKMSEHASLQKRILTTAVPEKPKIE